MFKKKEPVYRQTTEEDSWFTQKWNTPRGRAALKLGIYGIIVLFLLLVIAATKHDAPHEYNVNYKISQTSYEDCLNKLAENNFSYNFKVTLPDQTISFQGQNDGQINSGYKEDVNGILKYVIKDNTVYQVIMDQESPITNLFDNLNSNYLDVNYIVSLLKDATYEQNSDIYNYTLDNLQIQVTKNRFAITNIVLQDGSNTYNLSFSDVGKIQTENS